MTAYEKKKRAAKKKRRSAGARRQPRAVKPDKKRKKKTAAPPQKGSKKPAKKAAQKRGTRTKAAAAKKGATTAAIAKKKRTTKKRATKATKAAKPKRGATTAAIAKKTAAAKKRAAKAKKLRAENARLRKQVAALKKAEQKARALALSNPKKKRIRAKKTEIGKARLTATVIADQGKLAKEPRKRARQRTDVFEARMLDMREILGRAEALGELPKAPKNARKRKVKNDWNIGEQRYLRIKRFLFEEQIERILYRARAAAETLPNTFKLWIGTLTVSAFGEKLVGSGIRLFSKSNPGDILLQTQGYESTGAFNSREGMLDGLETLLTKLVDEKRTVVFIHYLRLFTYTPRRHG